MKASEYIIKDADIKVLHKKSKMDKTVVDPILYITADYILFEQGTSKDRRQIPVLPQNIKRMSASPATTDICFNWYSEREIVVVRIPTEAVRFIGPFRAKKRTCIVQ